MSKTTRKSAVKARTEWGNHVLGLYNLDIQTGVEKLRPEDLLQREMPGSLNDAFKLARRWHTENWFVEKVCLMRTDFYNHGLEILPANPKRKREVEKFLEEDARAELLYRYIDDVWSEWVLQDSIISFWRKEAQTLPFLLRPEECKYTDAMGIERLAVRMEYKPKDIEGLSKEDRERYAGRKEILLDAKYDEYFKVLTRQQRGYGLGWPRLRPSFRTLSQNEHMEVGESLLAFAGRLVEREHFIGFGDKLKQGLNLSPQDYMYSKKRAKELQQYYQGRAGFSETVKQFDHRTAYNWVPPTFYDAKKWETIINRLLWWAGPVAWMVLAKQPNPFLLPLFKAEAIASRDKVKRHCEAVIKLGFNLPVTLKWSNKCFDDPRLAWSMTQALMNQGPLSATTGLERADFDPEKERERKRMERKNPEDYMPVYDPHHGNRPGQPGKPPGTKTGEGKTDSRE